MKNKPKYKKKRITNKRCGPPKYISDNYTQMLYKICPQCLKKTRMKTKKCECGYEWSCLCEGCGRDTNGSLFCRECIQPGYYHWGRIESTRDDEDIPPHCIPNWEEGEFLP